MLHDCLQDERIREISQKLNKLEERVDTMKDDLKDIKSTQNKLLWGVISVLLTSSGTLFTVILNLKGVS